MTPDSDPMPTTGGCAISRRGVVQASAVLASAHIAGLATCR